jgi:hypothetical protein
MRLLRGSLGFWQGNVLNTDLQQGSGFGGKGKGLHVERNSSGTCFDMKFWSFENSADPGIESCTHTHMHTHTHTNIQRVEDGSGSLFVVGISAICIQKRKLWIVGMFPDCSFQRPDLASITDPPSFLADESLLPDL